MILEMLLNENADVNAQSEENSIAPKVAAARGHTSEMLLNRNADVNAKSEGDEQVPGCVLEKTSSKLDVGPLEMAVE